MSSWNETLPLVRGKVLWTVQPALVDDIPRLTAHVVLLLQAGGPQLNVSSYPPAAVGIYMAAYTTLPTVSFIAKTDMQIPHILQYDLPQGGL